MATSGGVTAATRRWPLVARLDRLLTWKRARTYALVLVGLYVVAWIQVVTTGAPPLNSSGVPIGGDYIAFHAAARLLTSGQGAVLYDHSAVAHVQDALLGGRAPNFYDAYRNPPFYALLYAPLAGLDLLPAFAAFSLLSLGALGLALGLLLRDAPVVPVPEIAASPRGLRGLRRRWRGLGLLVIAFPPVYFGLIDGENATLSLLLYVLIWRALQRAEGQADTGARAVSIEVHRRLLGADVEAGLWAALGLFKPQLFLVFPVVFLARRQWRALASYAFAAAALAALSVLLVGPAGMQAWLRILVDMEPGNASANAWRMVSLKSSLDALLPASPTFSLALYAASALALLGAVIRVWSNRKAPFALAFVFTSLVAVLISPHLVDYDLAVLLPAGVFAALEMPRVRWWIVLLYLLTLFRVQLPPGDISVPLSGLVLLGLTFATYPREPGRCAQPA